MLDLLSGFIIELRNAGLPVSLTENLDAMHAISHIPLEDREAFKYALGATLVKNQAHWRSFETVFEVYFSLRGPEYSITDGDGEGSIDDLLQQMQEAQMKGEGNGGAGGMDSLTPEELIAEKYRGIRPAPGYPACPDHSVKQAMFELLKADEIGMALTESLAMTPAASVSGFYLSHPDSAYFNVGKIGDDQVHELAKRRGVKVQALERLLAPNL